ncbi:MAG: molybdopterin converting factor subunit 1 [Colwellia sp.]
MIKIVFFAALREQLNCEELQVSSELVSTVGELKQLLADKGDHWSKAFSNSALLSAVNHDMVNHEHLIKAGDEVAFFPPVTGG